MTLETPSAISGKLRSLQTILLSQNGRFKSPEHFNGNGKYYVTNYFPLPKSQQPKWHRRLKCLVIPYNELVTK